MEEKILQTKKNGMAVLLLTLAGYVAAIAAFVLAVFQMERDNYILGVPLCPSCMWSRASLCSAA